MPTDSTSGSLELAFGPSTYLLRADAPTPIIIHGKSFPSVKEVPPSLRLLALKVKFATYPFLGDLLRQTGTVNLIDCSSPELSSALMKVRASLKYDLLFTPEQDIDPKVLAFAMKTVTLYSANEGYPPQKEAILDLIENVEGREGRKFRQAEIRSMTWTRIFSSFPQYRKTIEALPFPFCQPDFGIRILGLSIFFSRLDNGTKIPLSFPTIRHAYRSSAPTLPIPVDPPAFQVYSSGSD